MPGPQPFGLHKLIFMRAYQTNTSHGVVLNDPMFAEFVVAGFWGMINYLGT